MTGAANAKKKASAFSLALGRYDPLKFTAQAGETVVRRVEIKNNGTRAVKVQARRAAGVTNGNLGIGIRAEREHLLGSDAGWMSLSEETFRIPSHRSSVLKAKIRIPRDAKPGEYLMGIQIDQPGQAAGAFPGGGAGVAIVSNLGVRFTITLPGRARTKISLRDAKLSTHVSGPSISWLASNDGRMIAKAKVESTLTDLGTEDVIHEGKMKGEMAPKASVEQNLTAGVNPAPGTTLRFQTTWRYKDRQTGKKKVARLVKDFMWGEREAQTVEAHGKLPPEPSGFPWWVWVIVGVAVLGAAAAAERWRRRRLVKGKAAYGLLAKSMEKTCRMGRPVSIVVVAHASPSGEVGKAAVGPVRKRLRKGDRLCDLGGGWLMVVAPDMGSQAANGAADEIGRALLTAGVFDAQNIHVGTATTDQPIDPADLVAHATHAASHGPADAYGVP